MSLKSDHEDALQAMKKDFFGEFQRVQKIVHSFINDLTAISGYAQLVKIRPEQSVSELHKIIHTVEKCTNMLRACLSSLKELERRYS